MTDRTLSPYEKNALVRIREWHGRKAGWLSRTIGILGQPVCAAGDVASALPGFGAIVANVVSGIVDQADDFARWTLKPDAAVREFQDLGFTQVQTGAEIFELDLETVDQVTNPLKATYRNWAVLEGGATGAVGLPGIPADLFALVALNLRATGQYGACCGFDLAAPEERVFAMHILDLASSPSAETERQARANLQRMSRQLIVRGALRRLENQALTGMLHRLARTIGFHLTSAKTLQIAPLAGAAVAGGINARFTAKVCDADYHLYRERFLGGKYGKQIFNQTEL